MRHEPIDVVERHVIARHDLADGGRHAFGCRAKNRGSVQIKIMHARFNRRRRRRQPAAARFLMDVGHARAVGVKLDVHEPRARLVRLQQHRPRAVTEQHAGGPVGIVDHVRHFVGADEDRLLGATRLDELRRDIEPVHEARTRRLNVEAADMAHSDHVGDQVRGGRQHEVRRDGRADQHVDFLGRSAGLFEKAAHGFHRHVRRAEALALQNAAFLDARALGNPLVAGVDHPRRVPRCRAHSPASSRGRP